VISPPKSLHAARRSISLTHGASAASEAWLRYSSSGAVAGDVLAATHGRGAGLGLRSCRYPLLMYPPAACACGLRVHTTSRRFGPL